MKGFRAAAALMLLAVPVTIYAQTVVQNGQSTRGVQQALLGGHVYWADSTGWVNSGDGAGNMYMTEANPDRSFLYKYQSIIQQSLFRTGAYQAAPTVATFANPQSDSSSAKLTLGATHLALLITYTLDDSLCGSLLCVEVRGHMTGNIDSVSTFAWRWAGQKPLAPQADTVGAMATTETGATVSLFSANTDTSNVGGTERPVWLNKAGPYRQICLLINNRDTGEWFSAPYTSVRVRIVKNYGSTACTAWTGKAAPRTAVNVDLLGWR